MSLLLLFKGGGAAPQTEPERRGGGGYWPSPEEWEAYLKKFHEDQRERFAQRAAERGIRAELKEGMFPRPPPKIRHTNVGPKEKRVEQQKETRFVFQPTEDNTAMRLRIAELVLDLRKRTQAIKKKKRRKKRDEAAIIALLS